MGMCIGAYITVAPTYIEEMAPKELSATLGVINQLAATSGILFVNSLSFILPYPSEEDAYKTPLWRLIFGICILFSLLQIILFLFCFKYETPEFYKVKNMPEIENELMTKIYKGYKGRQILREEDQDDQIQGISFSDGSNKIEHTNKGESFISLFSNKYRYALFICICLSAFHQFSGINAVIFHSNQMFTDGKESVSADRAARIGTFFIGVSGVIGALTTLLISKIFGRKTIMLISSILMMLILAFMGVMSIQQYLIPQIIGSNLFVMLFNASLGP